MAVVPGQPATVVATGTPGDCVAIGGSLVGAGFSIGGRALSLGVDAVLLAQGRLDAAGQVTFQFVPPFLGTTSDRYYIQAGTSPSPAFAPLALTPGQIVLNADLADVLIGPAGDDVGRRLPAALSANESTTAMSAREGAIDPPIAACGTRRVATSRPRRR